MPLSTRSTSGVRLLKSWVQVEFIIADHLVLRYSKSAGGILNVQVVVCLRWFLHKLSVDT